MWSDIEPIFCFYITFQRGLYALQRTQQYIIKWIKKDDGTSVDADPESSEDGIVLLHIHLLYPEGNKENY